MSENAIEHQAGARPRIPVLRSRSEDHFGVIDFC
jgi:hypothetical protein